jgi:hypothetical protein
MAIGRERYTEYFALALTGKFTERGQHQNLLVLFQCAQLVRGLALWHRFQLP